MKNVIAIFHFGLFFTLLPPNSPKNENITKMKIISEDIIILQKCTKSHDHMLYCSWDMVHDGCNCYFSFWAIFCPPPPSPPSNSLKNKNLNKMKKKPRYIIILHKCTKNHYYMLYCSWDMAHEECNCCFSFWAIFALLPH